MSEEAWDVVVIGSGPGGSSAAIGAASTGMRVLIVERGGALPHAFSATRSTGQLLNALKRLDDRSPNVAGGGAAINYGVVATPTRADVVRAVGPRMAHDVVSRYSDYLRDVGMPQASATSIGPVHRDVSNALTRVWRMERREDGAVRASKDMRMTNENTLLHAATSDSSEGIRRHHLRLASQKEHVSVQLHSRVDRIAVDDEGGVVWRVFVSSASRSVVLRSRVVVVACGALETPRLLLHSAARGGLPRGISPHVGAHLIDHGRHELTLSVQSGLAPQNHSTLPLLMSQTIHGQSVHVETVHYSGLDACGIRCMTCLPCKSSDILECLPSWLTFGSSFSTETFDPCCCVACGVAPLCNPCRCVPDVLLYVVGTQTSVEGSVSVDEHGRRITRMPRYSAADVAAVQACVDDLQRSSTAMWSLSLRGGAATGKKTIRAKDVDTQWHFGGTARVDAQSGDGAVAQDFRLLDKDQAAYDTLYVADASLMRSLTTFNPQTMASLLGYCGGHAVARTQTPGVMDRT